MPGGRFPVVLKGGITIQLYHCVNYSSNPRLVTRIVLPQGVGRRGCLRPSGFDDPGSTSPWSSASRVPPRAVADHSPPASGSACRNERRRSQSTSRDAVLPHGGLLRGDLCSRG